MYVLTRKSLLDHGWTVQHMDCSSSVKAILHNKFGFQINL